MGSVHCEGGLPAAGACQVRSHLECAPNVPDPLQLSAARLASVDLPSRFPYPLEFKTRAMLKIPLALRLRLYGARG